MLTRLRARGFKNLRVEALNDARQVLFNALAVARNLGPRRMRAFHPESVGHRVSELMRDYSALRVLPSFQPLESQMIAFFRTRSLA
jgi:hypothetical protein